MGRALGEARAQTCRSRRGNTATVTVARRSGETEGTTIADFTAFNHVGQCTTDLARAVRFYVELFGFEVERELEVPDEGSVPLLAMEPPLGLRAVYLRG